MSTLEALTKVMKAENLELTLSTTHPDLDVVEFQASLTKWPGMRHAVGRSHDPERAIVFALRLWSNGGYGVWDEKDEADGGKRAAVGRRT